MDIDNQPKMTNHKSGGIKHTINILDHDNDPNHHRHYQELYQRTKKRRPNPASTSTPACTLTPQWVCDSCGSVVVGLAYDCWCDHEERSLRYVVS